MLERAHVEIQEKPDRVAPQAEVGPQLRLVNCGELLDGLHFDHDKSVHEEVEPETRIQQLPVLADR